MKLAQLVCCNEFIIQEYRRVGKSQSDKKGKEKNKQVNTVFPDNQWISEKNCGDCMCDDLFTL